MDIAISSPTVDADGSTNLGAQEAAAQLLAMVAADDTKNPHLLHVDKWISTCCNLLSEPQTRHKHCKLAMLNNHCLCLLMTPSFLTGL